MTTTNTTSTKSNIIANGDVVAVITAINNAKGFTLAQKNQLIAELAMHPERLPEVAEALNYKTESERIGKEYTSGSKKSFKDSSKSKKASKASAAQRANLKEAKIGEGMVADAAFVPGDDAIVALPADDDSKVVEIREIAKGTPEDGKHYVHLAEYPVRHEGRNGNGDYRILRLVDEAAKVEWTKLIGEEDLSAMLSDINNENHAMLTAGGKGTVRDCFNILMNHDFACWTVVNNYDKTCTYFRLEGKGGYKGYLWFLQNQEANRQDKEQAYKDRKVAEAQKAIQSNGNRKVSRKSSNK